MGHFLSQSELSEIRSALSDAFVDNQVDYAYIAERIKGYDLEKINNILYSEVAVVCHTNLLSVLPQVWTGFDSDSLNTMIEEVFIARKTSWLRRQLDRMLVAWLRYQYAYIWKEISKELQRQM